LVASQVAAHGRQRGCLEPLGKTLAMALLTGGGEERCPSGCHDPHSPLPLEWADVGENGGNRKTRKRKITFNKHMLTISEKPWPFPGPWKIAPHHGELC